MIYFIYIIQLSRSINSFNNFYWIIKHSTNFDHLLNQIKLMSCGNYSIKFHLESKNENTLPVIITIPILINVSARTAYLWLNMGFMEFHMISSGTKYCNPYVKRTAAAMRSFTTWARLKHRSSLVYNISRWNIL